MKKLISLTLTIIMAITMVACGASSTDQGQLPDTIGGKLAGTFEANADKDAQAIVDAILADPTCDFNGASMPVEPGYLNGFSAEINGFEEGIMFSPMIGAIPFVGYIFVLADGADTAAFIDTLKTNADMRWNICTEADEMFTDSVGNKVFFVMCPTSFEE